MKSFNVTFLIFVLLSFAMSKNFLKKKQLPANSSYSIVVLGDFGQFDQFNESVANLAAVGVSKAEALPKLKTTNPNAYEKFFLYKSNTCDIPLEMTNFKVGVLNILEGSIDANEAMVLGDAVYTEGKNLGVSYAALDSTPEIRDRVKNEFTMRLKCAWEKVKTLFTKSPKDYLKSRVSIVFGNHSMDVKYATELQHMSSFYPWVRSPSKVTKVSDDASTHTTPEVFDMPQLTPGLDKNNLFSNEVVFVDFDMSKLVCSNKLIDVATFTACIKDNRTNAYPDYTTDALIQVRYTEHVNYYNALVVILKTLAMDQATWKVVRVHQPPFNVERDFDGVKNNVELMNLFKKAHIHFWLVSHNHSAQVNLAKYTNDTDYKKYKITKNTSGFSVPLAEKSTDVSDANWTSNADYFYEQNKTNPLRMQKKLDSKSAPLLSPSIINRCKSLLVNCENDVGVINIQPNNEEYHIQLLAGNSGRKLDGLGSDLLTDSRMLYGRAVPQEFGFFTIEFSLTSALVKFYNGPIVTSPNQSPTTKGTVNFTLKIVQNTNSSESTNFKVKFTSDMLLKTYKNVDSNGNEIELIA